MWKEISPQPGRVIYVLDQQQRDRFPKSIQVAQFQYANEPCYPEGIIHSVVDVFPARLSTTIKTDSITYRLSVHFYDEQEAPQKIGARISALLRRGESYPPAESDQSSFARELRAIHQYQILLQQYGYVTFPSCQRVMPRGPLESDPHRALEDHERQHLLPFLDTIVTSLGELELKKPLREADYYRKLIKRLIKN